jgi:hypothetical protein
MGQSFGSGIQLVEVTTDDLVRGEPKKQVWVAAARPELAVALVLAAVPEGWSAALSDVQLKPEEIAVLKMQPGDVRELTKEGRLSWRPLSLAQAPSMSILGTKRTGGVGALMSVHRGRPEVSVARSK